MLVIQTLLELECPSFLKGSCSVLGLMLMNILKNLLLLQVVFCLCDIFWTIFCGGIFCERIFLFWCFLQKYAKIRMFLPYLPFILPINKSGWCQPPCSSFCGENGHASLMNITIRTSPVDGRCSHRKDFPILLQGGSIWRNTNVKVYLPLILLSLPAVSSMFFWWRIAMAM